MNRQSVRRTLGLLGVLLVGVASFAWGCAEGAPDAARAAGDEAAADQSAEMETMKAMLLDGFTRAKAWDVGIAEAIPADALDWAPNENVRSFADQVVHAANNGFIGQALFGEAAPPMAVEEGSVTDKAALVAAVGASYDWIIGKMSQMDAATLAGEVEFFGQSMPRWRVGTFALEHAMWTRGQVVPYFHANGIAVPDNVLFGG